MTYKIPQEVKDARFNEWVNDFEHQVMLLKNRGYKYEEALEVMKLKYLCHISDAIYDK